MIIGYHAWKKNYPPYIYILYVVMANIMLNWLLSFNLKPSSLSPPLNTFVAFAIVIVAIVAVTLILPYSHRRQYPRQRPRRQRPRR